MNSRFPNPLHIRKVLMASRRGSTSIEQSLCNLRDCEGEHTSQGQDIE